MLALPCLQPEQLWGAIGILAKLVNNIVQCGNALEKYRYVLLG